MRPSLNEWLALLAAVTLVGIQVLIPPVIGLANNGDFSKITGRFSLGPARGDWSDSFIYVTGKYREKPEYFWNSGLFSSELILAGIAVTASRVVPPAAQFDIRWMGAVHAAALLAGFWLALLAVRPSGSLRALTFIALVLFVFTDICYASYLNSFYMDTAALLGLLLMTFAACAAVIECPCTSFVTVFVLAALLLITSKGQHALFAAIPAAMALVSVGHKRLAIGLAVSLLAAGAIMLTVTPREYSAPALFSVIFDKIVPAAQTPVEDLAELGLDRTYLPLVGSHAYQPGSPLNDTHWISGFLSRTSYGAVARFYFRHPARMGRMLYADLQKEAPRNRAPNLGNFQRDAGMPPGSRSDHFDIWSRFRTTLFRWWPAHVIAWYAVMTILYIVVALRSKNGKSRKLSLLCLLLLLLGAGEYALASLADSCETHRHFFLFHAATDLSVCLFLLWLFNWLRTDGGRSLDAT